MAADSASSEPLLLGVDVGTLSARAALIDSTGRILSSHSSPLELHNPDGAGEQYEYSSDQVWSAVVLAVRGAMSRAQPAIDPSRVRAVAFDATCSLVVVGEGGTPLDVSDPRHAAATSSAAAASTAVSPAAATAATPATATPAAPGTAAPAATPEVAVPATAPAAPPRVRDTIVWMDHRAVSDADAINRTGHALLSSAGGRVSPEMHLSKLRWLSRLRPDTFSSARHLWDLTDWLAWRACGAEVRSVCTVTCKMLFQAHRQRSAAQTGAGEEQASESSREDENDAGWDRDFFERIGLSSLGGDGWSKLGRSSSIRPVGSVAGKLTPTAAAELGLSEETIVAVGLIDAHAGGLGVIGASIDNEANASSPPESSTEHELAGRLALICGTSTCHMAVTSRSLPVPGVWGPYFNAMVPNAWLLEGGESATGALIDWIVDSHPACAQVKKSATEAGIHAHEFLHGVLRRMASEQGLPHPAFLTRDVHVLPYFHGCRSPRADPSLRGIISGLTLAKGVEDLAVKYLAALQALAYSTRHILETMRQHGVNTRSLFLCGGLTKNDLFVQQHAGPFSCKLMQLQESDGVLLGCGIVAATAAGLHPSLTDAMRAMSRVGSRVPPTEDDTLRRFHERKFRVYLAMYDAHMQWRNIMDGEEDEANSKA